MTHLIWSQHNQNAQHQKKQMKPVAVAKYEFMTTVTKMKVKQLAEISGKPEVKTTFQRDLNLQIQRNAKDPDFNELTLKSQIHEFMLQGHILIQTLDKKKMGLH